MNLNEKYMKPIKGQITMIAHKGGHFENGKLVGGEIIEIGRASCRERV